MLASSITAYIQAVIFFHILKGHEPPALSDKQLKATLNGIRNVQSVPKRQKDPIQVNQLLLIYDELDQLSDLHVCFWAAALLLFRTLLRVSHVTTSLHSLKMADFVATQSGFVVSVKSSKVAKPYHKTQRIPVSTCKDKRLCPVHWLDKSWSARKLSASAPAFACRDGKGMSYNTFMRVFKNLLESARVKGDLGSHSFRRGGATLLAHLDCSIIEIKARGRWASVCVFEYLKPTMSDELCTDLKLSSFCSKFA